MATVLSATPGLLKISTVAETRTFLAQLTASAPAQRQSLLLTQLKLLADTRVTGITRLQVLETLREVILETQHARSKEYWGKPVPFDDDTREIFERSIALWRAVADAYESLIADMAGAEPALAAQAGTICYRALRSAGFAMTAHNRAYHAVPDVLWEQLHRLYVFAETADATDISVSESGVHGTVNLAYLQIILAQRAIPDALTLLQMNTVDRALAQWVPLARISRTPFATESAKALAVDLGSAQGSRRIKNLLGHNLRYLDLEQFGDKLRQTAVALKTQSPEKLGLGPISREECDKLLFSLNTCWLATGTGRIEERKTVSFNVLVSTTIADLHYNIGGKPFMPPDADLHSRARFEMAGFQFVDGAVNGEAAKQRPNMETWAVANQSKSGILGMCRNPDSSTRLTHNQLLGLVAPNKNTYLGFVQRLSVDNSGATWVALRLVSNKAQAVAARESGKYAKFDRALLLAAGPGNEPPTVIVAPGTYSPGRILDMHDDGKPSKIKLTTLLDRGPNFERAAYAAA